MIKLRTAATAVALMLSLSGAQANPMQQTPNTPDGEDSPEVIRELSDPGPEAAPGKASQHDIDAIAAQRLVMDCVAKHFRRDEANACKKPFEKLVQIEGVEDAAGVWQLAKKAAAYKATLK